FETPDSSARKYRALQLFQEVLAFRLSEKNTPALVDADLKRFQFGYQQSTNSLKDTLFLQALQALNDQLAGDSAQSEVQLALAKYYIQQGNTHDVGSTDPSTRWAYKTAFDILTEVEKSYPNSFAAKQVNSLKGQIKQKQLEVKLEEVILPAQPALVQVSYRNISSTKLRLVRISPEEYWEWEQMNQNQKYAFIAEKSVVKDLQITPPDPKDYHRHRTEIILEPLPLGYYVLAIAENGDFASQQEARGMAVFQVSRLAALKRQMRGQQSGLLVVDRTEGNPLPEVNVKAYKQSYNRRKRASEWDEQLDTRSARNGFANLNLDNNGRYKILLSRGEDRLYIDNYYGRGYYNYQAEPRLITHFFLDRAIYRPGQTVYFKALVYQYKPKEIPVIAPGQIIEIGFFNVNNEEVATLELKTNEYGTVEGSFQIPQGGLTGGMSLQSSTEDEHYFRVEEYKRPKFEAQLLPIEGDYALGDTVTATGNAMTFAGAPLDGATVQYRVVREVRYPWWPWWRYGRITPRSQSAKEITFGETKTDEKGNFNIPFQALADPSADSERNPAFTFKVYAAVVDITGETHTAITTIKLADLGLEATIDFPETADISDLPDLQIVVKNLNSQVTNTGGKLVVHRLQAPERYYLSRYWELPDQPSIDAATFRKNFPLLAFKNEDKAINWPVQRTELTATVDSFQNLSAIDMSNWPVGFYRMEVEVQDKNGNAITTQHTFSLYNSSKKQAPPAQLNWATITKKQGEPGQTLPLWLSSAANQQIYYELESRAGIEAQKWIDVGDWEEEQIKIKEAYRGNILVHLRSVRHNRHWQETITLNIPWSNKDLSFEWQAFRDKLKPGAEEEWTLIVKGAKKDQLAAELVASLYDASLDQFVTDSWQRIGFPMVQRELQWTPYGFSTTQGYVWAQAWQQRIRLLSRSYDELDWFNWFGGRIRGSAPMPFSRSNAEFEDQSAPMAAPMGKRSSDEVQIESAGAVNMMSVDNTSGELDEVVVTGYSQQEAAAASEGQIRTNLNETVFFYPTLRTDKDGNVRIKFTMNEALTRWKFQAFAHTKELDDGIFTDEVVTQKELMIMPNPPRFVRESDQLEYTAKVVNLSEQALSGTAKLDLFDASNMQEVNALLGLASNEVSFQVEGNQSTLVSWKLTVPKGKLTALTHRASAQAGNFSDAEESTLPVLTNRMLVTESIPMAVKGNSTETFTFESLKKASTSSTLDHHQFTLEYTSNPAWYAVQALPYLMEYPHDCTEQIFSRYYANTLASSIANHYPKIKRVYESWRAAGQLESNLTKNQDLKAVLLEETPWVLDAQSEAEQKARIALLFDLNRMSNEQDVALSTLVERQAQNGGFSWFPGGRESWYITQHLVEG
ncbi:MAG: alpha-2-macroglobulin family protein, partial [Bacteroidota bacterium]